jgi:hypothetical protein
VVSGDGGWATRLGRRGVPLLHRLGLPRARTRADLALCERDPARHAAEQVTAGAAGLLLPLVVVALLALAGISLGVLVPAWASILLAAGGLYLPEHTVRAEATQRRAELRSALSSMLDLVVVGLAGGAGVEQALRDATANPQTWGQHRLRRALHAAQLARVPPWQTLGQLGADANVPALTRRGTVQRVPRIHRFPCPVRRPGGFIDTTRTASIPHPSEVTMFTALTVRTLLAVAGIRDRVNELRRNPDAGAYTTEGVIVIALLAAAAIAVVGIIVGKITARANSINLGP